MAKLLKFDQLNEYNNQFTTLSEQELLEMVNITYKKTGIDNVVIWIGPNLKYHGKRIKISNIPNYFKIDNCFTMTIPDFKIIGDHDKKFITNKVIEQIKLFVELNIDIINSYSDYEISTEDLLDNLKQIKEIKFPYGNVVSSFKESLLKLFI